MKNISEDQVKAPEEKKHTPEQAADQRPFTAAVITLSDKGAKGQRVDESGPAAVQMLEEAGYEVREAFVLPDEPELLEKELIRLADELKVDLVLTSGGTGFSLRDRTPDAMLSRGVSVIRKGTLIINLPGSPKAVRESLGFILHGLDHGLRILRGSASECAAK